MGFIVVSYVIVIGMWWKLYLIISETRQNMTVNRALTPSREEVIAKKRKRVESKEGREGEGGMLLFFKMFS